MIETDFLQRFAKELADQMCERLARERDDRPLLRVRDLAARLGTSERTARSMVDRGEIPSFVIAGNVRVIAPAAVDAYVQAAQESDGEGN
jgi:excisionase family DNA binding protein